MILELAKEDIEVILYALGKLTNETDTYPLGMKIRGQIIEQEKESSE